MRFSLKPKPMHGEVRIIKKFAVFPIKICREIRWLETVTIAQRYGYDWTGECWYNMHFVD